MALDSGARSGSPAAEEHAEHSNARNAPKRLSKRLLIILLIIGVAASVAFIGFLVFGGHSSAAQAEVDYPTIQVQTLCPGASPDVTTSSITAPLERQFGQMPDWRKCPPRAAVAPL